MESSPSPLAAEELSALCDGESDATTAAALSTAWRDDALLRQRWHGYHLIGDVLRSDDLAGSPAADADFLRLLRARLASEPVLLAPVAEPVTEAPPVVQVLPRRRWMGSGAIAAGFVAVAASVFVLLQGPQAPAQLASAPVTSPPAAVLMAQAEQPATANMVLVRDAGLDRYLAAHQQFGGSALAVPSGFLRNATYEGPSR